MLNYIKAEFLFDNFPGEGVVVLDWNAQNAQLSKHHRVLEKEFPLTYKKILTLMGDKPVYRKAYRFTERGYEIYVLFAVEDITKVDQREVVRITTDLLKKIADKAPGCTFISSFMYREFSVWGELQNFINKQKMEWKIYVE